MYKIKFVIQPVEGGYSAWASEDGILTEGNNLAELKANMVSAVNLQYEAQGHTYTEADIEVVLDVPQFFAFYKEINAAALAPRLGMSRAMLAQYAAGLKKPSAKRSAVILEGIQQLGRELAQLAFA